MHEIGLDVSHSQYQKHGAYLLEYADMPGFPREEQRLLACLVGAHRRKIDLDTCEEANPSTELTTRDAPAIRFRNPMMTFHLVDPWYPGDANCLQDRAGDLGQARMVHPGYAITLELALGFFTQLALAPSVFPVNVVRGPENSVWVLDEGEGFIDPNTGQVTRGQAYRIDPGKIGLDLVNVVR